MGAFFNISYICACSKLYWKVQCACWNTDSTSLVYLGIASYSSEFIEEIHIVSSARARCELTSSVNDPILHHFPGGKKNMFSSCLRVDGCRADVSATMCQLTETSALMVCSNARHRSSVPLSCLHGHHFLLCWHRKLVKCVIFIYFFYVFVCFGS